MRDPEAFDFDGDYGEGYRFIAETVIPGYDQVFEAVHALLHTHLDSEGHVLVVGCGTGKEIEHLSPPRPGWRFTAVDPSTKMIEATGSVVALLGVEEHVRLHHGHVRDLPMRPEFDAATVMNVMHFLPDDGAKQELLTSVAERVRPEGPVVLFDLHGDPASAAFATLWSAWLEFMEHRGLVGQAKRRFVERLEQGIAFVPEARILELCRSAGLGLEARFFSGFLYGGWLLKREITE